MDWNIIISFLSLTFMEIVLGMDNLIFISILSSGLEEKRAFKARFIGLSVAVFIRIILLFALVWIIGLNKPLFVVLDFEASWRDLVLIAGGLFLIWKSVHEVHQKLEGSTHQSARKNSTLRSIIMQIILLDIVFSFDSILTAIGMSNEIWVMIAAIIVTVALMFPMLGKVAALLDRHPSLKILALSFLMLIGFMLILDGLHYDIPKGYIYFALFFSLFVELLNIKVGRKSKPVILHDNKVADE